MQAQVSIIIPTFNNAKTLKETLESVLAQTYANWECLIIDDGSTDAVETIINKYLKKDQRIQFYKRPNDRPKGANACRNYGFKQITGDFVMFLDADDVLTKSCLENRIEAFSNSKKTQAVVADTALLIQGDFKTKSINQDTPNHSASAYLEQFLSYQLPWTIMSVLWKREILIERPFDETLQRFQDVDFHIRILKQGCCIFRLYQIDNYYRVDPHKVHDQQHIVLVLKNLLVFYQKHIPYLKEHREHGLLFQRFINCFLELYLFPNYHKFNAEVSLLLKTIYSSGLYSKKQFRLIKTQEFLVKTRLYNKKYIGMYRLMSYIRKGLEHS